MAKTCIPWTPADDALLLAAHAAGGFRDVLMAFPERTPSACRQRIVFAKKKKAEQEKLASGEGVSVAAPSDPWTHSDDMLFIEQHRAGGMHAVCEAFPGRSRVACERRLQRLRTFGLLDAAKPPVLKEDAPASSPAPAPKQVLPPPDHSTKATVPYVASPLERMASHMASIPPFDVRKKGLTQYVQRPDFGDKYEFIRRRLLWEMDHMAEQLGLPPEVVYRAVQVLGAFDYCEGSRLRPPSRSHDHET